MIAEQNPHRNDIVARIFQDYLAAPIDRPAIAFPYNEARRGEPAGVVVSVELGEGCSLHATASYEGCLGEHKAGQDFQ